MSATDGIDNAPRFQRTGSSSPLGKLDAELPKQRINSETIARLQLQAAEAGMSLAEFVRLVLDCKAFGSEHVASLHADRIRRVGAIGG
ncbi:MAG: hypothetical protein ACWA66_02105 [Methylibium petroleiphilum]